MSSAPQTNTTVAWGGGSSMNASSRACSSSAALRFALRDQQLLGFENDDDPARRHHRQRLRGIDQRVDLDLAAVQAIDVERAEPLLDQAGELARHRRLLDIVSADQHVERRGLASSICFADQAAGP